ncbi:hypothetical protein LLEC1_04182 [Akanthomyces lecanii]|uniref:NmrA-like domain-containing protein n=1 Tax=Cordyceps confragosa TaxID=2714763 RepID=A0A179I9P8_CORDF|nr:hypothetical protein LLEC1_04182 [Akanthomyces lecanii]
MRIVDVDFASVPDLTSALRGQDVVVSTLPAEVASLQVPIIDAAVAAGVPRFLPTEYGSNISNPLSRQIPVFAEKVKIEEYLEAKAAAGQIAYTFVYTGAFLEWGIRHHFVLDVAEYKPTLLDEGRAVFSTTNVETLGRALVAIVEHLDETKNRAVFLEDLKISQARLLELARTAAPEKPWQGSYAKTDDLVEKAGEGLAKGIFTFDNIAPFLYRSIVSPGYGGSFEKSDNELLGLGQSSEEFVLEQYKKLLQ